MAHRFVYLVLLVVVLCVPAVVWAQLPTNNVGDPVVGDGASPNYLPTTMNVPPPGTAPGFPAGGQYDIIVNAYIASYARVDVYDNWINFKDGTPGGGQNMDPLLGTWAAPAATIANGNIPTIYTVNGVGSYDLGGGRVQTNCRLNMQIDMGGNLRRVNTDGSAFTGTDTRRADNQYYELATQYKLCLHGRYLQWQDGTFAPAKNSTPAENSAGTQYVCPTSGTATDYNTWTEWDGLQLGGTGDITNNSGWLWADVSGNFPWDGLSYGSSTAPIPGGVTGYPRLEVIPLIVERGQAQNSGYASAPEWWIAERVWRRGLQDVSGNYRQHIGVEVYYRESPTEWLP